MIDHFFQSVLSQNMQAKNVIHIPLVDTNLMDSASILGPCGFVAQTISCILKW
jgi:hypothetical protein